MSSRSGELISLALQKSLPSNCKKAKISTLDDCIGISARKVLSTKIEYVYCPEYSTTEYLKTLKSKYTTLKPDKSKKKKKKKNKLKNCENFLNNQSPMKNTELNGQNLSLPAPKFVLFSSDDVQLGWKNTVPVGSGFINLGTTCYINSTLQALFHVPSFVNWLKEDKKHETSCEKMNGMLHTECVVCAMSKTLQMSHRANGANIRPKYIIEKVKTICKHLSPFRQEDAHEFLRYLLEAMEKSYTTALGIPIKKLDSYSKETTPLNQIFGGYIRTEVTCLECSHVSTTFQHFQDLILDIRQNNTTTVYDGLESYFSKERLDGDESYHCERCKKKVSAHKKFSIERAPNVLCIQLKRFNINSFYGGSKISKSISTPQTIDLSKFKHRKGSSSSVLLKYRLVSMVFHHGPSANSGHYTALGCTSSGSYYYFNDEQVFPVHLGNYTNNPNAYIMFYELEKPSSMNGTKLNIIKSSNSSTAPLSNGCLNGNVQVRTNGIIKRDNLFSPSNHVKQPSWQSIENKENKAQSSQQQSVQSQAPPMKSIVPAPVAVVKSTTNSLVPYTQSSDSESSDVEVDKNTTDSNNNSKSSPLKRSRSPVVDASVLSPLAKKNSTLTSLLTSSPKNETSPYHVTSSSRPLSNGKLVNGIETKETTALQNGNDGLKSPEERNTISFSMFKRDRERKKLELSNKKEEAGLKSDGENSKSAKELMVSRLTTTVYSYLTNANKKTENGSENDSENASSKKGCDEEKQTRRNGENVGSKNGENGHTNEGVKMNGIVNGVNGGGVPMTNGWIVTEIKEECNTNTTKLPSSKIVNLRDWIITEKENRKSLPMKDSSKLKDSRKSSNSNGNKNGTSSNGESRTENTSSQNDSSNSSNHSYSSQNGYGGKVLTWNGDLSYINKESEQDRKESTKRSYNYDEEIDRGKVKKAKYYNRNENGSNGQTHSPRKNLIQQHHNQYNGSNSSNSNSNNNRNRRWQFTQNEYHFNNKRYSHNGHFRNNNYFVHRTGNFTHSNSWRR